jgi:hypothetical protein
MSPSATILVLNAAAAASCMNFRYFISVALDHLFNWIVAQMDQGRAFRVFMYRNCMEVGILYSWFCLCRTWAANVNNSVLSHGPIVQHWLLLLRLQEALQVVSDAKPVSRNLQCCTEGF